MSATEAFCAISSSGVHKFQDDAPCRESEAEVNDLLQWFSEIISSYKGYIENDVGSFSVHENSTGYFIGEVRRGEEGRKDFQRDVLPGLVYNTRDYNAIVIPNPSIYPKPTHPFLQLASGRMPHGVTSRFVSANSGCFVTTAQQITGWKHDASLEKL
ncbi:unnamed protein product [Dovyalis caffra]|uniref:Uncharacterized protein n=1 Tax=Dovyalis caffra TaxID=77055 RepID=A0AAV1QQF2_9ROSI|nr:unnamed protein product [Dovyalis caffra]